MTLRRDTIDDPRLTAYVLGELTDDERAAIERELADSPLLTAEVQGLREAAALIGRALAGETPPPGLSAEQRTSIVQPATGCPKLVTNASWMA